MQRVLNMLDFAWNLKTACDHYGKPDVIMASSQTPFACMRALKMAKQMKAKSIMEVTDLWPESLVAYGLIDKSNPALIPMYLFEKKMYQNADEIIFSFEGSYDSRPVVDRNRKNLAQVQSGPSPQGKQVPSPP